jgi:hypothetical protein
MRIRLVAALLLSLASASAFATQTTYEFSGFLSGRLGYQESEPSLVPYATQFLAGFTIDQDTPPDLISGDDKVWLNAVKGGWISFGDKNQDLGTMWNKDGTGAISAVNDFVIDGEPYYDHFSLIMPLEGRPEDAAGMRWFMRFAALSDPGMIDSNFSLTNPLPLRAMLDAPSISATVGYAEFDAQGNQIPDSFRAVDGRVLSVSVPEPEVIWLFGAMLAAGAWLRRRAPVRAA